MYYSLSMFKYQNILVPPLPANLSSLIPTYLLLFYRTQLISLMYIPISSGGYPILKGVSVDAIS